MKNTMMKKFFVGLFSLLMGVGSAFAQTNMSSEMYDLAKMKEGLRNRRVSSYDRTGNNRDHLKAIKPDIVYCSITGYASDGMEAQRPGYDIVIQGEAGLMAINGDAHLPPLKFGTAIVDMVTGLYAAQAVLAALFAFAAAASRSAASASQGQARVTSWRRH